MRKGCRSHELIGPCPFVNADVKNADRGAVLHFCTLRGMRGALIGERESARFPRAWSPLSRHVLNRRFALSIHRHEKTHILTTLHTFTHKAERTACKSTGRAALAVPPRVAEALRAARRPRGARVRVRRARAARYGALSICTEASARVDLHTFAYK